jgi:hypothetical protein
LARAFKREKLAQLKMKPSRSNLNVVIGLAAGVTGIYLASILVEPPVEFIFGLGLLAAAAIVWMAIRILQDPYSTDKTFDKYFYQDREDIRRIDGE